MKRTRWLIPPLAGLCRPLVHKITCYSTLFDSTLQKCRLACVGTAVGPNKIPRAWKPFGRFGQSVGWIVVLPEALIEIGTLAAVVATAGLALHDINTIGHKKALPEGSRQGFWVWLPSTDSNRGLGG